MLRKTHFKMISGGLAADFDIGKLRITVSPFSSPPFPVEAMVFEEDTNLILTTDPNLVVQQEHPIRLFTSLMEHKPHPPGSLVVNGRNWYAVVVDVDSEEICRQEWIDLAYSNLFRKLRVTPVHTIGLTLLGTCHVHLEPDQALELLLKQLNGQPAGLLSKIWLIVPEHAEHRVCDILRHRLSNRTSEY